MVATRRLSGCWQDRGGAGSWSIRGAVPASGAVEATASVLGLEQEGDEAAQSLSTSGVRSPAFEEQGGGHGVLDSWAVTCRVPVVGRLQRQLASLGTAHSLGFLVRAAGRAEQRAGDACSSAEQNALCR